jgi:hypothetical protein
MLPGLTPERERDLIVSVGTHRGKRRLSPVEVAESFQTALNAGASAQQCARAVGFSGIDMVSRFLKLLDLRKEILHTVDWGQAGATLAFDCAWRLGTLAGDEQIAAARAIMANQMSKAEVVQLLQLRRTGTRSLPECISDVLRMRPMIVRRHVLIGAISSSDVADSIRRMPQPERDSLISSILREICGPETSTSGRLGIERFTIVTDEAGAVPLRESPEGFESRINRELGARLRQ